MAAQTNSSLFLNKLHKENLTYKLFCLIRKRKKEATILKLIQEGADIDIDARDSKGYRPLLLASKYGLKTVVKLLIDSGAVIDNSECPFKRTLLHYASGHGWTEVVQSLVKSVPFLPFVLHRNCSVFCEECNFPTIHAKDMEGRTALHLASLRGHLEVVKCLVEKGANLVTKNKHGETALHEASGKGHLEIVKFLVGKGAHLNVRDERGESALHKASGGGHLEVVKYLLGEGADIEVNSSCTPLLIATKCFFIDVIVVLINSGANVDCCDDNKDTLLHYASQHGCIEMVQYLVRGVPVPPFILNRDSTVFCDKGTCANIHARDIDGRTALHMASYNGHLNIIKFLVAEGADPNARDKDDVTALKKALCYGHSEVAKFLVEEGADVNVRDKDGKTALHEASDSGLLDAVKCLVERGADINVKSCKGVTPLLVAAKSGHKDIVDLLVNSGANLDGCDQEKWTMLRHAASKGWTKIIQSFVKRGYDLDARDYWGETALSYACRAQQWHSVEFLLKAGARWDIRNNEGNLPLHYVHRSLSDYIKLFVEYGAYLIPSYYVSISHNFQSKFLLRDVKFCCQAIVNKFNSYDLPALYKLPVSASLPCIENLIIAGSGKVAQTIEHTVNFEIQTNGHCDVVKVRPMALSFLSVKCILKYYNKKSQWQKLSKRLAAPNSENDNQHLRKSMRLS